MSELFDTIEMKAQEQAELERLAYEEKQAERQKAKKAKRWKATRALLIRILIAVGICVAMSLAGRSGLMDLLLIRSVYLVLASWLSFWIGAWFQFMWCKGGLLEW